LVVFAGDVYPIDTYSHMPIVCEEANIPYCFVPSKLDLGHAMGSKKSACVVLVKAKEDYKDLYDKCIETLRDLPIKS
jgi:ribosomal protein L7Ae-like RNA K-turn-binding protein